MILLAVFDMVYGGGKSLLIWINPFLLPSADPVRDVRLSGRVSGSTGARRAGPSLPLPCRCPGLPVCSQEKEPLPGLCCLQKVPPEFAGVAAALCWARER